MTEKKQKGAPRGNQNARKHGFYSRVLDEAREVESIDADIAVPLGIKAFIQKQKGFSSLP